MLEPRGVGVILGERAVADDKELHVLEQAGTGPEAVALVAVDLVERLADVDPAALELDVHERQAVDEDRDVVAVRAARPAVALPDLVLVDDLQPVVVDVGLVDELDVLRRPVVALEDLDVVLLDADGLLGDAIVRTGDLLGEEPFPLGVAERDAVQCFQLGTEVRDQLRLGRDREVVVRLPLQQLD